MHIQHDLHHKTFSLLIGVLVLTILSAGFFINPVQAGSLPNSSQLSGIAAEVQPSSNQAALPSLKIFAASLTNGNAKSITGVYVPNQFALPVLQQPQGQAGYVSKQPDSVTLFRMAQQYGTTALLAHNYLSGELFFNLGRSDDVYLVFGDGAMKRFKISRIDTFQALQPDSPYSSFVDLSQPDHILSVEDLFYRIYASGDHLVFQTCIERDGKLSWGRLFVTAVPVSTPVLPVAIFRPGPAIPM